MPTPKYAKIDFASLQIKKPIDEIGEDEIVFYDIETDDKFAPYAKLNVTGAKYGFEGETFTLDTKKKRDRFQAAIANPKVFKVGFNNCNFDDVVLMRNGYHFDPTNHHDGFLMVKACTALIASYALKFLMWWYLGDHHFAEGRVEKFLTQTKTKDYSLIPPHLLKPYHMHDLNQHRDIFRLFWETVQQEPHWSAYMLDLSVAPAIHEMELVGGLDIHLQGCKDKIEELEEEKDQIQQEANIKTDGYITNVNSSDQVADFLDADGLEMALTQDGNWSIKKSELMDLRSKHPLAQMMYRVREINGAVKYFKAYDKATTEGDCLSINPTSRRIPRSFGISTARTRRFTSSSMFGINFQNPSDEAKKVHLVPEGWLGVWIDATQIENVVHIYESEDDARRRAYEADEDWSEYVWLTNEILGGIPRSKAVLDSIPSDVNPKWSVYKQFKTAKLALNFGQGVKGFCRTTGLPNDAGLNTFERIHEACPAIKELQYKIASLLRRKGFVQDVFGHIYSGPISKAYKVVAYLIQGCGTGSLPKAQIYSNHLTLQRRKVGVMTGTTHDDNSCRLDLHKGDNAIFATLQELMYNMTHRFSYKFDNIPLRAKMYLSRTTEFDKKEIDLRNPKTYEKFLS